MLSINNLVHVYSNGTRPLDDISLDVPRGMFGLLGPNGAGESTLMRSIATPRAPTSGSINCDGVDGIAEPGTLRRRLGCLSRDFGVYLRDPRPGEGFTPVSGGLEDVCFPTPGGSRRIAA
ncbi:ATP-binding cassette domain-containing protein [Brevundimonas sp.]|uniref:ATP-binding cassette domain-containing protein n=1 Tax=Brevundimonas sp. TaxID=1871086 RepID=UPI003562C2DD